MMKIINKCYLGLGTNMGNKLQNLEKAIKYIETYIGNVLMKSTIIETKAWGNTQQEDFLNQIIIIETHLTAHNVLKQINFIEAEMGRNRIVHWGPRIIDIDILFYNDEVIDEIDLKIPHPYISERAFVLKSMVELSPKMIHPISKKTMENLLKKLTTQEERGNSEVDN